MLSEVYRGGGGAWGEVSCIYIFIYIWAAGTGSKHRAAHATRCNLDSSSRNARDI